MSKIDPYLWGDDREEQQENITRVRDAIAWYIIDFINAHMDEEFHVEQLREYVSARVGGYVAPGSPDRILRDLRQKGRIDYVVVSRSQSLYKALPISSAGSEPS